MFAPVPLEKERRLVEGNSPVVEFRHVEKTYDGLTNVVVDLCLDIERGEFLTLLGPSGSGKTTTLMMLAGFEDPTAGDILLNGSSLHRVPPHRRNMGVVFQNYALFPHMSVHDNVAYPLKQRRLAKADVQQRATRALQMVELDHLADRRPAQLSGGQQQRVALARALVFEPELVLMDEPLGALDKKLRETMQLEIKHLHESLGMTVVYVTHDQGEALTMSDRVAVFNDGVIQQIAPPREIYDEPQNSFVANFVGENNNLTGKVAAVEDGTCSITLDTGETVTAQPINVAIGAATALSIRPEHIVLRPESSGDNCLTARVSEVIYSGDHSQVRLSREDGSSIVAKVPARAGDGLAPGTEISIGWAARHARALDLPTS